MAFGTCPIMASSSIANVHGMVERGKPHNQIMLKIAKETTSHIRRR